MNEITATIVGVLVFVLLLLFVDMTSLVWQSYTLPKRAEIQRKAWENTRSFKEGKRQELVRYRLQYLQAQTVDEKKAIASTVRLSFADVNREGMEKELKEFLEFCFNDRRIIK